MKICVLIYCPTRGMGEKPSPLGEDFSLMVDVASRIQGAQGPRIQGKTWMVFSLGPLDPKPSALAEGIGLKFLKVAILIEKMS